MGPMIIIRKRKRFYITFTYLLYFILKMQLQDLFNLIPNLQHTSPQQFDQVLSNVRQLYENLDTPNLSLAMYKLTEHIIRLKSIQNQALHNFIEQLVKDVIKVSIKKQFTSGTQALRNIFDTSQEYYKHSHIDMNSQFPLGYNRPLNWYQPGEGQECDVVKPYLTSTSFCGWTRGIFLSKQNKKYTVQYANTQSPTICKQLPFFAPLGSRTQDFQWRMGLNIGSIVDAFNKVWYRGTVIQTGVQNSAKRVRISFRIFSQSGAKFDSQGNRYDGLGPNQDDWMDILSYRIQRPGKMSKQLCYYSHFSEETLIDDTYDLIFQKEYQQKPFFGIMRLNWTRSQSFLTFYQVFCQNGGNQMFQHVLKNYNQASIDYVFNMMIVIGNTSFLVPRMAIYTYLPTFFQKGLQFLFENSKNLNALKNEMAYYFFDTIGKRILSLSQKHMKINQIRKVLSLDFLKMNMEKQMLALRFLFDLIKPFRPYNQFQVSQVNEFLKVNQIYYQLIHPNMHYQILSRSVQLLKYMIDNEIISWKEVQYLWNIFPQSDSRGRATIQKLIGDISKNFPIGYTNNLIEKVLSLKQTQLTIDNLNLLRSLKDHKDLSEQQKFKIVKYLWDIITTKSKNIKTSVEQQIEKVFKAILVTFKSAQIKIQFLNIIVERLKNIISLSNQLEILRDFMIMTYPKKKVVIQNQNEQEDIQNTKKNPQIICEVVEYLKVNKIYQILIGLFSGTKNPQKVKNILDFSRFLFQYDKDEIKNIVAVFYEKIGPTDIFLQWAEIISHRAQSFFVQFFNNLKDIQKLQKLSNSGFQAIKNILYDINIWQKNIKMIKKTRGVAVAIQGQGQIGPAQKPETLTFIYVLKSPFQCRGLKFLQQLLCVVSNNKVYDEIIKLIIQLIVNLDESIKHKTKQFRSEFLMSLMVQIDRINQRNSFSDKIKQKLEIYISLIQQLFSQTQKDGLANINPHFQSVQGQILKLKVQNNLTNNKLADTYIQVNQNTTMYTLKMKIGQIFNTQPMKIDVCKFTTPIADELLGKSLNQLHFFNDESIKISTKGAKEIPRRELLNDQSDALSQKFNAIVEKWFNKYKSQIQGMGLQQLKKLSGQCWKGSLLRQVHKLQQILKKFDIGQKGYLNEQEFKQFFISKSIQNPSAIWKIINLSGYNNNFHYKDDKVEQVDVSAYPRRILSCQSVYRIIFTVLQNPTFEPLHLSFYRLLAMLQTDINLKLEIRKNAKGMIADQLSLYRLAYVLQTIIAQITSDRDFYYQFFKINGHQFVYHKLSTFNQEKKSIYSLDTLTKTIIYPNMLKIINLYFYPFYSYNKQVRFLKTLKVNQTQLDLLSVRIAKIDDFITETSQDLVLGQQLHKIHDKIMENSFFGLTKQILFNLIDNFANDFLIKCTNQAVRLYGCLSVSTNFIDRAQLLKGLKSQSLNFRRSSQNLIYFYLCNHPEQIKTTLDLMLFDMPTQSKFIYSNYFGLLQKVLQKYLDSNKQNLQDQEFISLTNKLFNKVFNQLQNQKRNSVVADKVLLGVLININIILTRREGVKKAFKHLKKQLLQKCLFFYFPKNKIQQVEITEENLKTQKQPQHFKAYVKCKTDDTRKVLMEIIFHLHQVSAEEDPHFIDQYILPIFNDLPIQRRKFDTKALHVGLSNLGSTCYMNSMLQVLNSIGPFRNALMMVKSESPVIKQLKSLFSYLFFSQRQDYAPKDFLKAFVPPISTGIQQDTTQFLNFLFDQIQRALRNTQYRHLLEQLFKGSQAIQMICHSCGAKRQRQETFFTYSVQIEGKYDLNTALQGMHSGQLIADCFCQNCGTRSDTTKRAVIEKVPNVFFVHLKRIIFNYDVFANTKIHTRLQFPTDLNFEPYTKQGLQLRESLGVEYLKHLKENQQELKKFQQRTLHGKDKDYYKLKLKGIIVHSGAPQVGHYYAILQKQSGWIKFDDSRVLVYPHSSIQNQCYGGNFVADQWGGMGSSTNAYVLVYEKQLKDDIVVEQAQNQKKIIPYKDFIVINTKEWYRQTWLDNHALMLQNHLLNPIYCRQFLHFLVSMLQISPSNSKIKVISETLYKVCYQSGQVCKLQDVLMANLHQITPDIFIDYVIKDPKRTFDLLFHNNANVRDFTAVYIEKVVLQTFRNGSQQIRNEIFKFLRQYLANLHADVAKNWLRIDGYFRLFDGILGNSCDIPELHYFLRDQNLISYFIDFIMEKASPINLYPKKYSVGTKSNPAHFGYGINIIFFLIRRSFGLTGENYEIPKIDQKELYHLSDNDVKCVSSMDFYEKMIRQRQNLEILGLVIQRLSIKNIKFSEAISRVLLKCLNQITDAKDQMQDLCSCITKFLIIKDQFWMNRAQFVLGYSSPYIFGDNLLSSLDEERFVFLSTLEDLFPIQSLLAYCHINRLRNPLAVIHIIKTILESCSVDITSKKYLLNQKSPSYYHIRYLDWVRPYVNTVLQTLSLSSQKKQAMIQRIAACNKYLDDLDAVKESMNVVITGKIGNSNIVDRFTSQDGKVEVIISNVETYTLASQPTGQGNAALDHYLAFGRLSKKVSPTSNILKLFKQVNKPLALKNSVQEAQQKQILSLFDDYPSQSQQKKAQKQNIKEQSRQNTRMAPEEVPKLQAIVQKRPLQLQEVVDQVNVLGLQLSDDYFRKIQIMNNSQTQKNVTLRFQNRQNSNMLIPSKIHFISTNKAVQTMWVCKQNPLKGWGVVDYNLNVEQKDSKKKKDPDWFKIYGSQQHVIEPQPNQIEYNDVKGQNFGQYQGELLSSEFVGNDGQIQCQVCTLFNPVQASHCEVCGAPLK